MGIVINLLDGDGNRVPFSRWHIDEWSRESLTIKLDDYDFNKITHKEIKYIMYLIDEAIKYGVPVSMAREYLDLLDKLKIMSGEKTP